MMQDLRIAILGAIVTFLFLCTVAFAADLKQHNCEAIRAAVAEHGKIKAIRWARQQGYTWAEIAEARKCLR